MSRAFVKESDGDAPDDGLPEKSASDNPNYVTPGGLAELRRRLEAVLSERRHAADNPLAAKATLARFDRDIRSAASHR